MPRRIEDWLERKYPRVWSVVSFVLRFRLIALCFVFFFYLKSERDDDVIGSLENEVQTLNIAKNYLQTQINSSSKLINEMHRGWWKKEFFPETGAIVMMTYNDAFWETFLKPMGLPRYYYVLKQDKDVFPEEQALKFTYEEMALYYEWLKQPMDEYGKRPILFKEYENTWVDLQGNEIDDGYYRYVTEHEGHIYFYGETNEPKESDEIKIIKVVFLKPRDLTVQKTKKSNRITT